MGKKSWLGPSWGNISNKSNMDTVGASLPKHQCRPGRGNKNKRVEVDIVMTRRLSPRMFAGKVAPAFAEGGRYVRGGYCHDTKTPSKDACWKNCTCFRRGGAIRETNKKMRHMQYCIQSPGTLLRANFQYKSSATACGRGENREIVCERLHRRTRRPSHRRLQISCSTMRRTRRKAYLDT